MTKNKLIALGLAIVSLVFGAAVQQGLVKVPDGVCPAPPPCAK